MAITRRHLFRLTPAERPQTLVHIASLLVHATPAACKLIERMLRDYPGVEVHPTPQAGKLAVVLESADDRAIGEAAARLQEIAGVIGVSVVAHVVETEQELQGDYTGG
jgi:nitrate reductase NapD